MLPLNDPLWRKLDDAHRDRDIPDLLARLAVEWDDEAANSLFWNCLCHQGTCYGATYAAIPHLLLIAAPEHARQQRLVIALFAGQIALRAFDPHRPASSDQNGRLQGLPDTLEAWDRKLDSFRGLVRIYGGPDRSPYEREELLPRYRKLLAIGPVNTRDLARIRAIGTEFLASLPQIRAVSERALLENLAHKHAVIHLLSGGGAADGLLDLASLLDHGSDGQFRCSNCHWDYNYILFGDRIAVYASETAPSVTPGEIRRDSRRMQDYDDKAPSRSDGFMVPVAAEAPLDRRAAALLSLAERATDPEPAVLARHFLGHIVCCKCGKPGPIHRFRFASRE